MKPHNAVLVSYLEKQLDDYARTEASGVLSRVPVELVDGFYDSRRDLEELLAKYSADDE